MIKMRKSSNRTQMMMSRVQYKITSLVMEQILPDKYTITIGSILPF